MRQKQYGAKIVTDQEESLDSRPGICSDCRVPIWSCVKTGSGKTTFLRRLAYVACTTVALPVATAGFPILIRIGELEEHVANCLGRKQEGITTALWSAAASDIDGRVRSGSA